MAMRWIGLVVALVATGACAKKDALFCDDSHPCMDPARPFCDLTGAFPASDGIGKTCIAAPFDAAPGDASPIDASGCGGSVEGTTTCSGSTLMTCTAGTWVPSDCALGCFTDGTRCWDVDPSNGLGQYLDKAAAGPDLVLTDGALIDLADGSITNGDGNPVGVPHDAVHQGANEPDILVYEVHSLVLNDVGVENLNDGGGYAIAFVVDDDVTVQGHVDVGARQATVGPGGIPTSATSSSAGTPCFAQLGDFSTDPNKTSGSGGGGYGGTGGHGGANVTAGGVGALADGTDSGEPLRGGCGGANGSSAAIGGGGGGAIQIVSRTSITIEANASGTGLLDAGGGGGQAGGSGGGSGGLVLLEAPTITISGSGAGVAVNGGGGAGGRTDDGSFCSPEGQDGTITTTPAAGGVCTGEYTNGGAGGAGATPAGNGVDYTGGMSPSGAGGGGGSVGRIRFDTVSATITQGGGTVVSGNATYGTLSKR